MFRLVRRRVVLLTSVLTVCSVALSTVGSGVASAQTSSTAGVTSNSVTLGLLGDFTGALGSSFFGAEQGAQARINEQNAMGGVNGRKIKLVIGDTQSNPNDALQVTQSLVQQKNAFTILETTAFFTLVSKWLSQEGVSALTGYPIDGGPQWSEPSNHDLVDGAGAWNLQNTGWGWLIAMLKQEKITKLATIAYGASAQSESDAVQLKAEAEKAGIQVVDEDNSVGESQTDLSANAVRMKNSGANGWVGFVVPATEIALLTALHQQNAKITAFLDGVWSSAFLQQPAVSIDQGTVFAEAWKTPEFGDNQVVAAMRKYAGYKGGSVPASGTYTGWVAASLAIQGLKTAGKNLTTSSFLNALHKQSSFTANGLIGKPVNLAQSQQGTYAAASAGNCNFGLKIVGTKYVPLSPKPYCSAK